MSIANRRTAVLENDRLRLTFLPGGGHIAAVTLKSNGVNPLWDPVWETIEPSAYDRAAHEQFGAPIEGGLLSGIAGHNLCFDFFGPPSDDEFEAGLYVHGEGSTVDYEVESDGAGTLTARAEFPIAGLRFERKMRLRPGSQVVVITETAENPAGVDRAVGWTQHVTLGPPFLEKGKTVFNASATSSKVIESVFAPGHDRLELGAEFTWPMAPRAGGGFSDLRIMPDDEASGTFTTHLMNPGLEHAYFTAWQPSTRTAVGYIWRRTDFPWLGIWEENYSRQAPPWAGKSLTRGMEFGASPFPEGRRAMMDRGTLFGERGYRWLPAGGSVTVEYCLFVAETDQAPEAVVWRDGAVRMPDGLTLNE